MLIHATLNEIKLSCSREFPSIDKVNDAEKLTLFIRNELETDFITRGLSFNKFKRGFSEKVKSTPYKEGFLNSEINCTREFLFETFYNIPSGALVWDKMYQFVLLSYEEPNIFKYFIRRYDLDIFVRVVLAYELIKYLVFLMDSTTSRYKTADRNDPRTAPVLALFFKFLFDGKIEDRISRGVAFEELKIKYFPDDHELLPTGNNIRKKYYDRSVDIYTKKNLKEVIKLLKDDYPSAKALAERELFSL